MAEDDAGLYKIAQDVHDRIIRHHIAINNGYEMNQQGDAFEIVFVDVASAANFCKSTQLELLQAGAPQSRPSAEAPRARSASRGREIGAGRSDPRPPASGPASSVARRSRRLWRRGPRPVSSLRYAGPL
eukprot:326936-Prorocentrum_minimum.AAC.8